MAHRRRIGGRWLAALALATATVLGASAPVAAIQGWHKQQISGFGGENVALAWDVAAGRPYLAFSRGDKGVWYMTRDTGGWVRQKVASGDGEWARIAIDPAGHAHIAFFRLPSCALRDVCPSRGIFYATNASGSWVVERLTQGAGDYDPGIAFADGAVHIVFGRDGVGIVHLTGMSGTWTKEVISDEPDLDYQTVSARPALTADSNGDLHVAYAAPGPDIFDPHNGIRYLTTRNSPGWISQTVTMNNDYNTNIAVGSDFKPHIVFVRDSPSSGRIGVVYATRVGGVWNKEVIPPWDGFPYVAVDSSNRPFVTYGDATGVGVGRRSGGGWVSTQLSNDYGYSPDVKVAADGTLRIAYTLPGINWLRELP